jgi:hypothetical protein
MRVVRGPSRTGCSPTGVRTLGNLRVWGWVSPKDQTVWRGALSTEVEAMPQIKPRSFALQPLTVYLRKCIASSCDRYRITPPSLLWFLIQFRKHSPVAVCLPHRFVLWTQMIVWLHWSPTTEDSVTNLCIAFHFLPVCLQMDMCKRM